MKRRIRWKRHSFKGLLALLLCIMALWGGGAAFSRMARAEELRISVTYGIDGKTKGGRSIRAKVKLVNGGADFQGSIQMRVPWNEDSAMFQKEVVLAAGESKDISMDIKAGGSYIDGKIKVRLVDGKGKKRAETSFTPSQSIIGASNVSCGVLSDNYDSLSYLNEADMLLLPMKGEDLPDTAAGLDMLDMLIINDFETESLSKGQYEAVKEWVAMGGSLVIGTGNTADKTLAVFSDDFIKGTIKGAKKDGAARIALDNASVITQSNGIVYHQKADRNKGNIQIISYDLGDYPEKRFPGDISLSAVLQENLSNEKTAQLYQEEMNGYGNHYALMQGLNVSASGRYPTTGKYALILAVYIILVGPGLYLILKKKDKRELMWILVPGLACVFTLGIYLVGSSTRINKPFSTYISYLAYDEKEGQAVEDTYFSITAPYHFNYEMEMNDKYSRLSVLRDDWGGYRKPEPEESWGYRQAVKQSQGKTLLEIKDFTAFAPAYFTTGAVSKTKGSYSSDLAMQDKDLKGSFTNELGSKLTEAMLFHNNLVYALGDVADGETVSPEGRAPLFYNAQADLLSESYRLGGYGADAAEQTQWKRKGYALDHYLQNRSIVMNQSFLVGFLEEENSELLGKTGFDSAGVQMAILPLTIPSYSQGAEIINDILQYGESDEFYDKGQRYINMSEQIMRYCFGSQKITGLRYEAAQNAEFGDLTNGFAGQVYALNLNTGAYDLLFESGVEGAVGNLEDYLDQNNELLLKFVVDGGSSEYGSRMPVISAVKEGK